MKSRYEGIQNYIMHADESCFFLSLLSVAEEERERRGLSPVKVDFLDAVRVCMDRGWLKNDFTVLDDCAILKYLVGVKCTKEVRDHCYALRGCQYSVAKYGRKVGDGMRTHFRRRYFDVYTDSVTVKEGALMCYYVYTFKEED